MTASSGAFSSARRADSAAGEANCAAPKDVLRQVRPPTDVYSVVAAVAVAAAAAVVTAGRGRSKSHATGMWSEGTLREGRSSRSASASEE